MADSYICNGLIRKFMHVVVLLVPNRAPSVITRLHVTMNGLASSSRSNDPSAVLPPIIRYYQTIVPTMYVDPYLDDAFGKLYPHWSIKHAATGGLAKAVLSVRLTFPEVALQPECCSVSLDMLVLPYLRVSMCCPRRTVYSTLYL